MGCNYLSLPLMPAFGATLLKYAHACAVPYLTNISFAFFVIRIPKLFKVVSSTLRQSYDCATISEITLKDVGKITWYVTTTSTAKWEVSLYFWDVLLKIRMTNKLQKHCSNVTRASWRLNGKITWFLSKYKFSFIKIHLKISSVK